MRFAHCSLAALALSLTAAAQAQHYSTEMDAHQAGTNEPGTGWGVFVIDTLANTCDYHIEHTGMVHNESAAHIHGPALPFETGPIARFLPLGSPKIGTWNYPEELEADLLAGLYYVNIHSHEVLAGEMRGQILPTPIRYCACAASGPCGNHDAQAGCANSTGGGARVEHVGLASAILDTFSPRAEGVRPNQVGLFLLGRNALDLPFGDGRRCVGGSVRRLGVTTAGPSGVLVEPPGIVARSNGAILAGETWHLQAWYRDPPGPCGSTFNLSDALAVRFSG